MAHKNRWKVNKDTKSNSFIISFTYKDEHGVPRRYRATAGRGLTLQDANQRARGLYLEMEKDPKAFVERFVKPAPKPSALPFDDVAATFLAEHVEAWLRPSTRRTHEQVLRVHLVPAFGGGDLRDVTRPSIDAYIAQKRLAKLSTKSVANHISVLSSIFEFASVRGWFDQNPAKGIKLPKVTAAALSYLDAEEAERFLGAVREQDGKHADVFLTALRTGMRQGELLALRWGDLRFTDDGCEDLITVQHSLHAGELGPTKSGKVRHVPMHPDVRAALLPRRGRHNDFVFSRADGSPLTGNILKHPTRRAAEAIDRPDVHFHSLRHSFASQLVMNGAPLQAVQGLLGHADIKMTLRYAHLQPNAFAGAVATLGAGAGKVLPFRRNG